MYRETFFAPSDTIPWHAVSVPFLYSTSCAFMNFPGTYFWASIYDTSLPGVAPFNKFKIKKHQVT